MAQNRAGPEEVFTADAYLEFMRDWEQRLNHYLRHGTAWRGAASAPAAQAAARGTPKG